MQKAPFMKGSGLKPLDDDKSSAEVHVFGKNLEDRVVTKDDETIHISFQSEASQKEEDDIEGIKKRKFEAITGEEDEETVFQGDFKLFIWDMPTSNWIERGRGQLKLNDSVDSTKKRSRLIMRVGGTLMIILNVAIRRSYFKVINSSKTNIRFTDSQTLWAASGSNANRLKDLIDERLSGEPEDEDGVEEEETTSIKRKGGDDDAPTKKTKAQKTPSPSPAKSDHDPTPEDPESNSESEGVQDEEDEVEEQEQQKEEGEEQPKDGDQPKESKDNDEGTNSVDEDTPATDQAEEGR